MQEKPSAKKEQLAITKEAFVPVKEEMVSNKNYRTDIRAALDSYCTWEKEENGFKKTIAADDLKKMMRRVFKLQARKVRTVIETFCDLGILTQTKDGDYVVEFITPFVKLDPETVRYCLTTLSALSFKVYCYLKFIYDYRKSKDKRAQIHFSVSGERGLLAKCGYASSGSDNRKMMNWVLDTLSDVGLIRITDPYPVKDGEGKFHGWRRDLIEVSDKSKAQAKSELVPWEEEFENLTYTEGSKMPAMWIGGKKYLYDKKKVKKYLPQLIQDSRNYHALDVASLYGDLLGDDISLCLEMMEKWDGKRARQSSVWPCGLNNSLLSRQGETSTF